MENEEKKVEEESSQKPTQKNLGIIILVLVIVAIGGFYYFKNLATQIVPRQFWGPTLTNLVPKRQIPAQHQVASPID